MAATVTPWRDLWDDFMRDPPRPQSGGRRGRPAEFHSTAAIPIVMGEIKRAHPELSQRARAALLADYINDWAFRHPPQAREAGLTGSLRDSLIRRICKACR